MTIDSVLLDAGALIDLERAPLGRAARRCRAAIEANSQPLLPAVVLAQVWRGSPRQHAIGKLRRTCTLLPFDSDAADAVGRLLALSGTGDVVDAAVIVEAIRHTAVVVTSDPVDLTKLADAAGYPVPLLVV